VMGFFKYIGYLAFPIQMAYRYPALARFMAAHWATGATRVVPVFGERGALLEHGVFDLFYNRPLTVRRKMRTRAERRAKLKPRYWHVPAVAVIAAVIWAAVDVFCARRYGSAPTLRNVWHLAFLLPFCTGVAAAAFAGGATLKSRVKLALLSGAASGALYAVLHVAMPLIGAGTHADLGSNFVWESAGLLLWRVFVFAFFATLGALAAEAFGPEGKDQAG